MHKCKKKYRKSRKKKKKNNFLIYKIDKYNKF